MEDPRIISALFISLKMAYYNVLINNMDQYNRDTWIIIGKRLLGGQLHKYNEDSIVEKRLKE